MIKSWSHKGLKAFFEKGSLAGIIPQHAKRLKLILQLLNAAHKPTMMDLPGLRFHRLKGSRQNYFSVTVRANWRLIFQFDGEDALLVDYIDYH